MDLYKCQYENCRLRGSLVCWCGGNPIYFCENHKIGHLYHNTFQETPSHYISEGNLYIMKLNDDYYESEKYICVGSTEEIRLFKYQFFDVSIPQDYQNNLKGMITIFINKLRNTSKTNLQDVNNYTNEFFNYLLKIVTNLYFNIEKQQEEISKIFNYMHINIIDYAKVIFDSFLKKMIDEKVLKKETSIFGFVTKKLDDLTINNFWGELHLGEYEVKKAIELFSRTFKDFSNNSDAFQGALEKMKNELMAMEDRARKTTEKALFDYLSELILNRPFYQLLFFQSRQSLDLTKQAFSPDWVPIENRLFRKENITISSIKELEKDVYTFVLKFQESNKSFLAIIQQFKVSILLSFDDTNFVQVSGCNSDKFILIKDHPRKIFTCKISGENITSDRYEILPIETNYNIISASFIEWKDKLIYNTSTNEVCVKKLNKDKVPRRVNLSLESTDLVQEINIKHSKRMVIVRTVRSILILNDSFTEILRLKSTNRPVEVFDFYEINTVTIFCLYKKTFKSVEIYLSSKNQREDFKYKLEKPSRDYTPNMLKQGSIIDGRSEYDILHPRNKTYSVLPIIKSGNLVNEDPIEIEEFISQGSILRKLSLDQEIEQNNPQKEPQEIQETEEKIKQDPFMDPKDIALYEIIFGQCQICKKACNTNKSICNDPHYCKTICKERGACNKFGKRACKRELNKRCTQHDGPHVCEAQFHSCSAPCPVEDCSVYCSRRQGHKGLHKCDIHVSYKTGKSCNNICFDPYHSHHVECLCKDKDKKLKYRSLAHVELVNKDLISCEEFWTLHNWERVL